MGKAAKREKAKRRKFLKSLSERDAQKFEMEWEKRLSSWLLDIEKCAGKLSNWKGDQRPPVFSIVDEAMSILDACGQKIFDKYARETYELLTNQCCISFSEEGVPQFYRMSNTKHLEFNNRYDLRGFNRLLKSQRKMTHVHCQLTRGLGTEPNITDTGKSCSGFPR